MKKIIIKKNKKDIEMISIFNTLILNFNEMDFNNHRNFH